MTTNTKADDAWKSHEEQDHDPTPETDNTGEPIDRYEGEETTDFGGQSVEDLMANVG